MGTVGASKDGPVLYHFFDDPGNGGYGAIWTASGVPSRPETKTTRARPSSPATSIAAAIAEFGSETDRHAFTFDGEFNIANRVIIEFIEKEQNIYDDGDNSKRGRCMHVAPDSFDSKCDDIDIASHLRIAIIQGALRKCCICDDM